MHRTDRPHSAPPPHVLRDYALLADGERGILVGPHGDVAWMCFPSWHSDAVFASLIGGDTHYTVQPSGRHVWGGYYEDVGLIWRARWITDEGITECREALAFPGDQHRAVVLRRVIAVEGTSHVDLTLAPGARFDRERMTEPHRHASSGDWHAGAGGIRLRLRGAPEAMVAQGRTGTELHMALTVPPGSHHDLVFELSDAPLDPPAADLPDEADAMWAATESAWSSAVPRFESTLAPRDSRQAYAVLRGVTSSSGGMVAASTTGLPERADKGRNFDYRYVWVRDQCYAGQAVAAAGAYPLLDDAADFISARLLEDGRNLMPAYTVGGGAVPPERTLALPGYPGGNGIVGNHVRSQFQLDAFGESLLLLAAAARHGHIDKDRYRAAAIAAESIAQCWQKPDAGVWELGERRWTQSRLVCAAGLRAMAGSAASKGDAAEWSALADVIVADAARDSLHSAGRWQRAPEDGRADAALLLASLRGAVPAHDPRSRATVDSVRGELAQEGFVYRFRHDERPLGTTEGAFLLCGFWMALAEHQLGHEEAALRWFERNRAAAGTTGLFSEEYDVGQHQLRGNLPQSFVHALLLEAAVTLHG
ncbi:glycoside hydrolase family 15 protein [Tomitella gaofuii]|uniref:glycoside hydrolase family 15 protein n=1 Tax=Tomitella gaofuii TaxID=2760083 RepID=UPI0015F9299C|nr:glycoside hydrolase family 15 protein [Tomitella gaofuii]